MTRAEVRTVGAIVLGGDYRGLGIVRSLGRHGIAVWVAHDDDTIGVHSRYCRRRVRLPTGTDEERVRFLIELADTRDLDGWVLFPTSEETAWTVSRHHAELATRYRLTTSPWVIYRDAADKARASALAAEVDIPVPCAWYPRSLAEAADLPVEFPVVIKPTVRVQLNDLTYAKAWRVDDREAFLAQFELALSMMSTDELVVQEFIPGGGDCQLSYAAVCLDGVPVCSVTAARRRQYPSDFGRASTFVETVDDPEVATLAERFLRAARLTGPIELEFKRDPRSGVVKLLDVNARAWGWHSIGDAAGVDFMYAAYCLALGAPVPAGCGKPGVRWVRLSVDLLLAAREGARGRGPLRQYVSSLRPPIAGPMSAHDDPLPAVLDMPFLVRTVLHHRWQR